MVNVFTIDASKTQRHKGSLLCEDTLIMKDFTTLCSLNPHALGGDINHTSSALSV